MVTILLPWPHDFATPLASSLVSWKPDISVLQNPESTPVAIVGIFAEWAEMLYPGARVSVAVGTAAMAAKDSPPPFIQFD